MSGSLRQSFFTTTCTNIDSSLKQDFGRTKYREERFNSFIAFRQLPFFRDYIFKGNLALIFAANIK